MRVETRARRRRLSTRRHSQSLAPLAVWLCSLAFTPQIGAQSSPEWQQVAAETSLSRAVRHSTWQLQRGEGAYERISVHRYGASPAAAAGAAIRAAVLYLPGTNMNGAPTGLDERYDLFSWLAARGVTVYALDYRTHAVSPTDDAPLAPLAAWTSEVFAEDAAAASEFVAAREPNTSLFVAGFSRGASFAYALACVAAPGRLQGVIALDGMVKSANAMASDSAKPLAEVHQMVRESGVVHSDVAAGIGWQRRDDLMRAVIEDPFGPASREGFAAIGQELAQLLYGAWGPGRLAHPLGASSGKGISRPEVLAQLLAGYDRYYPVVQNGEGTAIASVLDHPDTGIDDCFGELALPVLYFGSTGMGSQWLLDGTFSAVKAGPPEAEIHVLEGYGHLDVLVAESAAAEVFQPVLRFVEKHSQQ